MALKKRKKLKYIYEKWRNIKHNEMHTLQISSWYKLLYCFKPQLLFKIAPKPFILEIDGTQFETTHYR